MFGAGLAMLKLLIWVTAGTLAVLSPIVVADNSNNSTDIETDTCRATVVVTGYWPPTNEMMRQFSQNRHQNPEAWQGANWQGFGYDVFAFFPEFPPDGDPTNNKIGELGSVGAEDADFRVDYQDTSRDFWRIMDEYQPHILITTSRGGDIGWEIEAYEGGHGKVEEWASDRWGEHTHPELGTVDSRTSQALQQFKEHKVRSALPIHFIKSATQQLNLVEVKIDNATSGNYLSGFMGLHGLYYHQTQVDNLAAGHIHVGRHVKPETARVLFETTLATVLDNHPSPCKLMQN